jgi:hypothetical protein
MLRRMMIVAVMLGASTAFADGIAVTPSVSISAHQSTPMLNAAVSARVAARMSGQHLYKAILFSKTTKVPQPSEEGDIMF